VARRTAIKEGSKCQPLSTLPAGGACPALLSANTHAFPPTLRRFSPRIVGRSDDDDRSVMPCSRLVVCRPLVLRSLPSGLKKCQGPFLVHQQSGLPHHEHLRECKGSRRPAVKNSRRARHATQSSREADLGILVIGKLEVHGGAATLRCLDCSGRLGHAVHHQPLEEASRDACHSQDSSQHNRDRLKRV